MPLKLTLAVLIYVIVQVASAGEASTILLLDAQHERAERNLEYWLKIQKDHPHNPSIQAWAKERVQSLKAEKLEKQRALVRLGLNYSSGTSGSTKAKPKTTDLTQVVSDLRNLIQESQPLVAEVNSALKSSAQQLHGLRNERGFWEGKAYLGAVLTGEYILTLKHLGILDRVTAQKASRYLIRVQNKDGAWGTWDSGPSDLHWTCTIYFALDQIVKQFSSGAESFDVGNIKLAAERAKKYIDENGGILSALPSSKVWAALFGYIDHSSKYPPIVHLARNLPMVGYYNFASWVRVFVVPASIIDTLQRHPEGVKGLNRTGVLGMQKWLVNHMDKAGSLYSFSMTTGWALVAFHELQKAGLGDHQERISKGLEFLKGSLDESSEELIVRFPPLSNWDTPNALLSLNSVPGEKGSQEYERAVTFLYEQQVMNVKGDWAHKANVQPGGWGWMPGNELYPDTDDSSQILIALREAGRTDELSVYRHLRGLNWVLGMQSQGGGWAAFDKDNGRKRPGLLEFTISPEQLGAMSGATGFFGAPFYKKPIAGVKIFRELMKLRDDDGLILDFPSADVTGHVIESLAAFGFTHRDQVVKEALRFLEKDLGDYPVWYARWGVDYFWGTQAAVMSFAASGADVSRPFIQNALKWVLARQNSDGGWGQSYESIYDFKAAGKSPVSTATQTGKVLSTFNSVGQGLDANSLRAVRWLLNHHKNGIWTEDAMQCLGGQALIQYTYLPQYTAMIALGEWLREFERAKKILVQLEK